MTERSVSPLRFPHVVRQLQNGMRVIVHEDRTAPVVAVHVMYRVGSRDELPGRTGLAHLLEHLLFEGSAHCPKGEFDRLLESAGGTNNGSTWLDRTNYYEVVPSTAVELALWLERERMAFFLPVLDQEMLELQRGVVINERRQAYENRPYGMADERLHRLLFPPEHPYSWPTIGFMTDLEAMELEDARTFFLRYYTPRNAVLVLAGDIDSETGERLAERYFGDVPAGPVLPELERLPIPELGPTLASMTDRVSFPRVYRGYAVPGYGTREWVALDVLAYLLADGESSRLQRALVREEQLAQDVEAYLYPTQLAGVFGIVATARSGVEPKHLADAVDRVLAAVADGVTDEEVTGAVRRARRDQLAGLAHVEERAEELAYAATVLGSPAALEEVLDSYATITAAEVRDALAAWLPPARAATLLVVPDGEQDQEPMEEESDEHA